jgi:dynactin complex subunit
MNTSELLIQIWPITSTLIGGLVAGIAAHYTQKGRIDVLESENNQLKSQINHLNKSFDFAKEEMSDLRNAFAKVDVKLTFIVEAIKEIKENAKN